MTYTKPTHMMRRRPRIGVGDVWDDLEQMMMGGAVSADKANPADNVNETTGGGMSTSAADFVTVGGVCKPQNFPALAAVREFQRQMNRVAQVKGWSKIADDGAVGPGTLALFRLVQSAAGGSVMGDASSCMGVAPDVDVLGQQIKAYADSLGAPATVAGPIKLAPPSILTKGGQTVVAPDAGIAGSLATLSSVEKVALVGLAGGIGYMLLTKKRRR